MSLSCLDACVMVEQMCRPSYSRPVLSIAHHHQCFGGHLTQVYSKHTVSLTRDLPDARTNFVLLIRKREMTSCRRANLNLVPRLPLLVILVLDSGLVVADGRFNLVVVDRVIFHGARRVVR